MKNIHPVYHIKTLMIKRELAKVLFSRIDTVFNDYLQDPALANEDWSRFLPTFKKKNLPKRRTPHLVREKKSYTPFPPAPTPSKVDLQLDSGEYFLKQNEIKERKLHEKKLAAKEKSKAKKLEREMLYEAPDEDNPATEQYGDATDAVENRGRQGEREHKKKKRSLSQNNEEVEMMETQEKDKKKRKKLRKE